MLVKEVMKQPIVVDEDISLSDAADIMVKKKIGCLIYLVDEKIEGIVTDKDLLKHFGEKKKISEVMSRNVVTATPEDEAEAALELMRSEKIKRLPVVLENKLVGIVGFVDILGILDGVDESFFFD